MTIDGGIADMAPGDDEQKMRQNIKEQCYDHLSGKLLDDRGWRDEIELTTGSQMSAEAHKNRTVLELVQNARDAIRKDRSGEDESRRDGSVAVVVGPETLYVANTGQRFRLDEENILERVRRLGQGKEEEETIGEKGVGMRSIMALGERFGIHSTLSEQADETYFSVDFTGAHPWAMLTRRYGELLNAGNEETRKSIAGELDGDETLAAYAERLNAVSERLETCASNYHALSDTDEWPGVDEIERDRDETPPTPAEIINELPELSPFKYPYVRAKAADDPTLNTLLGRNEPGTPTNEALAERLSEEQYTTVVSVDYSDDAWSCLLDLFIDAFEDGHPNLEVPVEEWRETYENVSGESKPHAQAEVWEECKKTITEEVLILLGEIGTIDLVCLTDSDEGEAYESYEISDDTDAPEATAAGNLRSQQVTVTRTAESECQTETDADSDSVFHLYTKEWDRSPAETDEDDLLKLLYEEPQPDEEWCPQPQPLHLYYPIEKAATPFPFVVHAPFEVQMDRQNLDSDNAKNAKLLSDGDIQEFIVETVEDIVQSESSLRPWLPWLLMPLLTEDAANHGRQQVVSRFADDVCRKLADTACVPTFGGGETMPDQVLLEVSGRRLEAFEPVREYLNRQGQTEHERLPDSEVIDNGKEWLETVSQEGVIAEDRFCTAVERIGLTELLDRLPGDDTAAGEADFISVLGDIWGIDPGDRTSNLEIAVEAENASARVYFETVFNRLPDEGASSVAGKLGERHVPLLPALDYTERESEESGDESDRGSSEEENGEQIGYLVRAIDRNEESVIDRIVFREDSAETQREIDPPPSPFDVYLIPYQKEWHGALDDNAEEWGTSKFESETDIYRRVGSELGGYGENRITEDADRSEALAYLYDGYTEINVEQTGVSAELFHPVPFQGRHYHKKFSDTTDINGIGNLLGGEKLRGVTDDSYLQQVYIKRVAIPTRDGEWMPADQAVFGQAWTEIFRLVAEELESDGIDDPFEEHRPGETAPADDFRRWGTAIDLAASVRDEGVPVLAPPSEMCEHLGLTVTDDPDRAALNRDDGFWLLNFLLHLGVQVGPRVEWAWLNPTDGQRGERRPGALSLDEVRRLSDGRLPESDTADVPLTLEKDELERYADVCRRARNHPAFVVGHASNCGESAKGAFDEWSVYDASGSGHRLAIPMWWRFADLPSEGDQEAARTFRNAVLLLWPELSDRLFPTGWACAGAFGNRHQVKSPRQWIPSLGLVQLRQAPIWPSKPDEDEERDLFEATELVDGQRLKALRRFDYDRLTESLAGEYDQQEDLFSLEDVAPKPDFGKWLGISIDQLHPAAAAERLELLLERYELDERQYTQFRDDAFRLLRGFRTDDHLGIISDDEQQRKWKRRDIYHTETRLLVDTGGKPDTRRIGRDTRAEATVYPEALPGYAREQLEKRDETVVELPSSNPGPIAAVLKDTSSDDCTFGVSGETVPTRPTASGHIDGEQPDESVYKALSERVADLAAAYAVETNETKDEVQRVEKQLDKAVENLCVASTSDIDGEVGGVKSVKWDPVRTGEDSGVGIALIAEEIDGEIEPHYTVDALVDIVENEAVKDKFEVVLRAKPRMERYESTRVNYDLGNIKANELTELLKESLPAIATGVDAALDGSDTLDYEFAVPGEKEEVKSTYSALVQFLDEDAEPDEIEDIIAALSRGSLTQDQAEACLRAAIVLTFERDRNAATATLLNVLLKEATDIAAVLKGIADTIEAVDLTDWHAMNAASLRSYLTAVAMVEEFYTQVAMDLDEDGVQTKGNAVCSRHRSLRPSALEPIEDVLPEGVHTRLDIDCSLPVIVFRLLDDLETEGSPLSTSVEAGSDYRAVLGDTVDEWCRNQHRTSKAPVESALGGQSLCEYLHQWPRDGDGEWVLEGVKGVLEPDAQRSARENKRTRKQKERAFDEGESYGVVQTESDADIDVVDFPEVGRGRRERTGNSEVPAGDGRAGELSCIQTAWKQFEQAGEQQEAIIKELSRWRDKCSENDQWRMKRTADVFQEEAKFTDSAGEFDFKTYRQRVCDETEDNDERRKWFRMLVDVSEESGPGFDYIDPFGTHVGEEAEPNDWEPCWMRRVEVKSIDGKPSGGYRITLTGNEFRMARRSCDICENRRYLVRLVFGDRTDDGFEPTVSRDIDDILKEFPAAEDDPEQAEVRAWDALRGGKVPMSGSFK